MAFADDDFIRAIASVRRIAPGLRIVVGGLGAPADIETRAAVRVAELETVVNDDLGHDIGDSTLTDAAQALASELRSGDFIARFGGDEFVLLLPGADGDVALATAERLRVAIESALADRGVTCSIGISLFGRNRRRAMLAADEALIRRQARGAKRDRDRRSGSIPKH